MANSLVYHKFKLRQMGNNGTVVDLDADTINLMLVNATYAAIADATKQTHEFYSDVSGNEVSGTGYTAKGVVLANKTSASAAATGLYTFDNTVDPSWATATITASGAIVFKDTGVTTTSPLIAYLDFGGSVVSTAGTFTVVLNASGIFTV
jgi:hypothetical protein